MRQEEKNEKHGCRRAGEEKRSGGRTGKAGNRGSGGVSEGEVERLNERCRKPMKKNFHRWSGGRASIASEPLLPGQPPMSTLCTGFERRGMLLGMNKRFCRAKGDEDRLCPEELHPRLSDLTARPITPVHRLNWSRRRGWCLFSKRRGSSSSARPVHGAHPSRFESRARFLTLFAQ
jgi:hypothetical protein